MRKTILTVLVVLLAVMAVTCDNFAPNADKGPTEYTEDGRPLVQLTINIPRKMAGRALTYDLARNNVSYYEVAFKDPKFNGTTNTKIYRRKWNYTQTGKISVPAGDYEGADAAVLFAGRHDDNTLLAVGVITQVDGVSGTVISPNTSSVTFLLTPLENDVKASKTDSTFKITGPSGPTHDYSTSAIVGTFPTVTMKTDEKIYPLFKVPEDTGITGTDDITATYMVKCGADNDNYLGVMIMPATGPGTGCRLISGPATNSPDYGRTISGTVLPDSITTIPATGVKVPVTGIFDLKINTQDVISGLTQISIEVPVCAIDVTYDFPGTWYIRGGLSQEELDHGTAENSLGGAVLLGIGAVQSSGIIIITQ